MTLGVSDFIELGVDIRVCGVQGLTPRNLIHTEWQHPPTRAHQPGVLLADTAVKHMRGHGINGSPPHWIIRQVKSGFPLKDRFL